MVSATTLPSQPASPSTGVVVLALMLLLGTQPVSTDLYLPSLPSLPQVFGVPLTKVQLTLSVLVISFGFGQLVLGPVADRFGRRPVLLAGLSLYTLASAAALVSPTIAWLIACRAAQGLGMAACVVCARAMLRDLYDPAQGAHVMARAATWMGLLPVSGPILGGYLETTLGWRGAFGVLTLFGATGLAVIALRLPETLRHPNPHALRWRPMWHSWRVVLSHPSFWAYTAVSSFTYAGLFCFIAGSSFVMVDVLGLSRREYGVAFAIVTSGFLIGSATCRRLVPRLGLVGSIRWAAFISVAAGTAMAALALAGVHHPLALMMPAFVYTFAHGIHQPCAQMGAVGPFPTRAGAATALSGFLSMALAFGMGYWMGWSHNGTVYPLALTMAAWCFALAAAAWLGVGRWGQPKPTARSPALDNTVR
ncbi:MAG: multidrug effflux MFS transporter [Caldimonas manganoxidans]|nr:multidrug effflux MFS transporter [Caldimonas manganoxidans]